MVIVSLGMTLIIEFGVQAIAGGTSVSYTMAQGPSVRAGGLALTAVQLVVIGLSLLVMAGTHVLLRYTRLGKAMRATAANKTLARNCGIRTSRVITITWAITGALCGLAGVIFAMDAGSFDATSTDLFLILILAATFLGGPGQAYGAMLGAVVIGLATEVSAAYITPSYKYVIAFVALLVMLGVRPTGLLGATRVNSYYLINLLIYAAVDATACLGLNQQFGVAGVTNFGFIIFQAAGGYTAAILALPPPVSERRIPVLHRRAGTCRSRSRGSARPWSAALIALPFTFLVGRRLRGDFAAVGLLVTAVLLNLLATNYRPLLNGDAGLSLIPQPLQGEYNPQSSGYQWTFTAVAIVVCALVYLFVRRITESPYGRSLRAMRDNDAVADSLGKNLLSLRTAMLVTGGAIAGLSGGILVSYITTWSPGGLGLRRDRGAVRGRDHRRDRQPPRRDPRRCPGAGRVRGGHPVHPDVQQPAAEPDPVARVGGDRAADRDLPVGQAAGHPARAETGDPVAGAGREPPRRGRASASSGRRLGGCALAAVALQRSLRQRLRPASASRAGQATARSCSKPSTCPASSAGSGRSTASRSRSGAAR